MRPRVIFVVAIDRNRVMGSGGELPWHLPADLRHFRSLTIGKTVIMGRKTFDAIGKPLPKRRNIVLTRADTAESVPGIEIARSVEDVFAMTAGEPEIAVIGGAQIFDAFAAYADEAYVTAIDASIDGDVYYRAPQRPFALAQIGAHPADEQNAFAMRFLRYEYANAAVSGGSANESKPSA